MSRLSTAVGAFIERIKINAITREARDGGVFWIKRRRASAVPVLACANGFFRLARASLVAIADVARWQRWEVECFCHLHGDRYRAFVSGPSAVAAEELPGVNLTESLDGGTMTPRMAAAAGRELRRAHGWECADFGGAWSHGDPHVGNFVYEPEADRARLIDFEVMHDRALQTDARHIDDVLVFLLDMAGRITGDLWLPCARAFLDGYAHPAITAHAVRELVPPRGIPRIWWAVRTSCLGGKELNRRFSALRAALR